MQYLLLIYSNEADDAKTSEADRQDVFQRYGTFTKEIQEQGIMRGADALEPISTATSVRVRDGKVISTDGPFAETKEQLGGYYLIEVDTLDEAIAVAARIPTSEHGTIEVRPVMNIDW